MPEFKSFLKLMNSNPEMWLSVLPALGLMTVNGWTDAPVTIASAVRTKALKFRSAIVLSAVCNFAGTVTMLFFGSSVAVSIYSISGLGNFGEKTLPALISASLTVILWSLTALFFGLPTSESHALTAGLSGAGVALIGMNAVNIAEWVKWIIGLFASTLPVAVVTIFVTEVIEKRLQIGEGTFKKMQIFGASVSYFAHGAQDGQKFAGVLALSASISLEGVENTNIVVPVWCSVLSAVFISCGVLLGGRKIVQSFDEFAPHKPSAGFSADLCSAVMLLALSVLGVSAATTIAKSSAVMGAGRALGVMPKTNVIKKMAFAWVLTVPLCFVLSFLITEVLEFVSAVC